MYPHKCVWNINLNQPEFKNIEVIKDLEKIGIVVNLSTFIATLVVYIKLPFIIKNGNLDPEIRKSFAISFKKVSSTKMSTNQSIEAINVITNKIISENPDELKYDKSAPHFNNNFNESNVGLIDDMIVKIIDEEEDFSGANNDIFLNTNYSDELEFSKESESKELEIEKTVVKIVFYNKRQWIVHYTLRTYTDNTYSHYIRVSDMEEENISDIEFESDFRHIKKLHRIIIDMIKEIDINTWNIEKFDNWDGNLDVYEENN